MNQIYLKVDNNIFKILPLCLGVFVAISFSGFIFIELDRLNQLFESRISKKQIGFKKE